MFSYQFLSVSSYLIFFCYLCYQFKEGKLLQVHVRKFCGFIQESEKFLAPLEMLVKANNPCLKKEKIAEGACKGNFRLFSRTQEKLSATSIRKR